MKRKLFTETIREREIKRKRDKDKYKGKTEENLLSNGL